MAVNLESGTYRIRPKTQMLLWVGRRGASIQISGVARWKRALYTACRAGFETIRIVTDGDADRMRAELAGDPRIAGRTCTVTPSDEAWDAEIAGDERWVVLWDEWIVEVPFLLDLAATNGPPSAASTYGPFAADAADLRRFAATGWQPSHPPTDALECVVPRPATYVRVVNATDAEIAENALIAGLRRAGEHVFARRVQRPLSTTLTRRLATTRILPNHVTLASIALGIAGACILFDSSWTAGVLGTFLFLVSTVIDGCDGELARLRFQETPLGARLDFYGDNVVHFLLFPALALRFHGSSDSSTFLWLAASSVVGLAVTIATIYALILRRPPSPRVARLFVKFQNREFAYVLFLLALAGRIEWFAWAVAVGVWAFPAVVAVLTWWERAEPVRGREDGASTLA